MCVCVRNPDSGPIEWDPKTMRVPFLNDCTPSDMVMDKPLYSSMSSMKTTVDVPKKEQHLEVSWVIGVPPVIIHF